MVLEFFDPHALISRQWSNGTIGLGMMQLTVVLLLFKSHSHFLRGLHCYLLMLLNILGWVFE